MASDQMKQTSIRFLSRQYTVAADSLNCLVTQFCWPSNFLAREGTKGITPKVNRVPAKIGHLSCQGSPRPPGPRSIPAVAIRKRTAMPVVRSATTEYRALEYLP